MHVPAKPTAPIVSLERVVLILEDEPMLRTSMARGLRRIPGLEVLEAGTLAEARQIARAARPHLVVSDLDLPDGTGIELLSDLAVAGLRIPVVFVSAYVGEYRDQLPTWSGIEIREKPLSLSDLRSTVLDRLGPLVENEAPFHVTDYIQLACMGARSVMLSLRSSGRLVGEILVNTGNVWSARDGHGEGEDAFRRLVMRRGLTVSVQAVGDARHYPRNIEGSGQHVLLEAARLQDEGLLSDSDLVLDESCFLDDEEGIVFGAPAGRPPSGLMRQRPPPKRSGRYRIDTPSVDFAAMPRRRSEAASQPLPRRSPSQPLDIAITPPVIREHAEAGRFDAIVDRAVELMLKKRYHEAHALFLKADELHPGHPRVRVNLDRLRKLGYV